MSVSSSPTARSTPTWLRVLLIVLALVVAVAVIGWVAYAVSGDDAIGEVSPNPGVSRSP